VTAIANIAIIGAGPYALSLAAHLKAAGADYRIFGKPMQFWKEHVPPGMLLKSLGSSTNLFDPTGEFTVANYCATHGLSYSGQTPIPVDVFVDYACAFQKRWVPEIDQRDVISIARDGDAFHIGLDDGGSVHAANAVIAVGIRKFTYIPEVLAALPAEFVTHSVDYGAVDALLGRKIIVIGSGASAIDLAAALHERSVDVSIIGRRASLRFQSWPKPTKFYHRLRSPDSPIGGGWDHWFYANAPQLFHLLPERTRFRLVATSLGPSPGFFMAERVLGRIPISSGQHLERAEIAGGRVRLNTVSLDGMRSEFTADHIVAATGFRVDLKRLGFLSRSLRNEMAMADGAPILSGKFETTAKGLYVIGAAAAPSFGPVMRFVVGAGYTIRRVTAALARSDVGARRPLAPVLAER
jgi:thioredoxin reductase